MAIFSVWSTPELYAQKLTNSFSKFPTHPSINRYPPYFHRVTEVNSTCQRSLDWNGPCTRKPFKNFRLNCIANDGIIPDPQSMDLDVCTYKNAGVITEDGRINFEMFKKLVKVFLINGAHNFVDVYFQNMERCINAVQPDRDAEQLVQALHDCEDRAENEYYLELMMCDNFMESIVNQ
ncbi:uncharacterized protein [Fopius arisanus]|uniref:Uncharacterized protein n=1 Tax=Fopius arisanus TaxID=64838 RepID=A0A9R1T3E6_9HYME|nr:PREDICTED: uncharacterized protein LOC105266182 [Fopius arisanus]